MKRTTLDNGDYIIHDAFSYVLEGAGGGGGGGHTPKIDDDTFRTASIAKAIIAYGIGECGGLKNGAKSIFFDRTPLMDENGNYNYEGVEWEERFGTQGQSRVKGFASATNVVNVATEVTKDGGPVVRTVQSDTVDSLRIIINIPNLSKTDDDGDVKGREVTIKFEVMDLGSGIWEDRGTKTISGKGSYPFDVQYEVDGPTNITAAWQYRVTRISDDQTDVRKQDRTYVSRCVEIEETKQTYPGVAYVALKIDTALFTNGIPQITLEVDGIEIDVPSNYTEEYGSEKVPHYSGAWDGTFQTASTSNPAWHLYHLIKNKRYGAGISSGYLDKYSFYEMAKYCDAVNNNGTFVGVTDEATNLKRRRFTFNTQITQAEDALQMLQNIASTARSILYYGAGAIHPSQDAPKSVKAILTNENVLDGRFSYSSTEAANRITVCNCTYNDYENFAEPAIVTYPNIDTWDTDEGILRYGRNESDIAKLGCNNEAEAYAFAKWVVWTSLNESGTVSFTVGPEHGNQLLPGDVVEVYDRRFAKERWGGRIVAGSKGTSIILDSSVTLKSGKSYQITIVKNDGKTVATRNITSSAGTRKTVSCEAFGFTPTAGYTWAIKGTDIQPQTFRLVSVEKQSLLEYECFAMQYQPTKYDVVEQGKAFKPATVVRRNFLQVKSPTNIVFKQHGHKDPATGIRNNLTVGWTASSSDGVKKYIIRYRREKRAWSTPVTTSLTSFEITDIRAGEYEVVIYAENVNGIKSPGATDSYIVEYGQPSDLPTLLPPTLLPAP